MPVKQQNIGGEMAFAYAVERALQDVVIHSARQCSWWNLALVFVKYRDGFCDFGEQSL